MQVRPGWVEEGVAFCFLSLRAWHCIRRAERGRRYPARVDCINGFGEALTASSAWHACAVDQARAYNRFPVGGPDQPRDYYDRTGSLRNMPTPIPLTDAQAALHSFALLYEFNPGPRSS